MSKKIITVKGQIVPEDMGLTLPHEHILVDFIGAEKTGKHRYVAQEVIDVMLPYLMEIKEAGVKTFVECTPMYLARDVEILRRLSDLTGLHILTNTGLYKEPYLPSDSFTMTAEELAEKWIMEYEEGIDGTEIRPGFIKTAVNPGELVPIQRKVIKAAAITSASTGLTIATHTGAGVAAMEVLDILEEDGVNPDKWIYVHAQNEENHALIIEIAKRGAWIELDGIGPGKEEKHLLPLLKLLDAGFEKKILLSQDAGWYRAGEVNGGVKRPYTYIFSDFFPLARERGMTERLINTIMVENVSRAFAI